MTEQELDLVLERLTVNVRSNTAETAAKVAKLYGASDEVCERIRMLKGKVPVLAMPSQMDK